MLRGGAVPRGAGGAALRAAGWRRLPQAPAGKSRPRKGSLSGWPGLPPAGGAAVRYGLGLPGAPQPPPHRAQEQGAMTQALIIFPLFPNLTVTQPSACLACAGSGVPRARLQPLASPSRLQLRHSFAFLATALKYFLQISWIKT